MVVMSQGIGPELLAEQTTTRAFRHIARLLAHPQAETHAIRQVTECATFPGMDEEYRETRRMHGRPMRMPLQGKTQSSRTLLSRIEQSEV